MSLIEQNFKTELKQIHVFFETYYDKKNELETSLKLLQKNKLPPSVSQAIQNEISNLDSEMNLNEEKRYELFVNVAKYVFNSPDKNNNLQFQLLQNQNSSKNDGGGYDQIIQYEFSGRLGELLWLASDFSDTGEVFFGYQNFKITPHDIKKRELTNTMTFDDFKNVFLNYFCDDPQRFSKYF